MTFAQILVFCSALENFVCISSPLLLALVQVSSPLIREVSTDFSFSTWEGILNLMRHGYILLHSLVGYAYASFGCTAPTLL